MVMLFVSKMIILLTLKFWLTVLDLPNEVGKRVSRVRDF